MKAKPHKTKLVCRIKDIKANPVLINLRATRYGHTFDIPEPFIARLTSIVGNAIMDIAMQDDQAIKGSEITITLNYYHPVQSVEKTE